MNYEEVLNSFKELFKNNRKGTLGKQDKFDELCTELRNFYIAFEFRFLMKLASEIIEKDEDRAIALNKLTMKVSQYLRKAIGKGFLAKVQYSKESVFYEFGSGEVEPLVFDFDIRDFLHVNFRPERYNYLGNPQELALFGLRCLF